ncbi:hypothetical protein RRG08_001169 [Elysia crispata]|uniref:Uncharacterized protein n=1 Tax=Elysia crispata TaxID=231223 RepID=A0AAE1A4V7_9GAST|nr:hypothetical protein RRG08_001169 [Elysia crispata]
MFLERERLEGKIITEKDIKGRFVLRETFSARVPLERSLFDLGDWKITTSEDLFNQESARRQPEMEDLGLVRLSNRVIDRASRSRWAPADGAVMTPWGGNRGQSITCLLTASPDRRGSNF